MRADIAIAATVKRPPHRWLVGSWSRQKWHSCCATVFV